MVKTNFLVVNLSNYRLVMSPFFENLACMNSLRSCVHQQNLPVVHCIWYIVHGMLCIMIRTYCSIMRYTISSGDKYEHIIYGVSNDPLDCIASNTSLVQCVFQLGYCVRGVPVWGYR